MPIFIYFYFKKGKIQKKIRFLIFNHRIWYFYELLFWRNIKIIQRWAIKGATFFSYWKPGPNFADNTRLIIIHFPTKKKKQKPFSSVPTSWVWYICIIMKWERSLTGQTADKQGESQPPNEPTKLWPAKSKANIRV